MKGSELIAAEIEPREYIADDERDPLEPPLYGRSAWRERAREKEQERKDEREQG